MKKFKVKESKSFFSFLFSSFFRNSRKEEETRHRHANWTWQRSIQCPFVPSTAFVRHGRGSDDDENFERKWYTRGNEYDYWCIALCSSFAMQRGTDRSRFERKRDLTFGACSSSTMKLPRDSPLNRLYFSYPFFFFFFYDTHFSLQDSRKKHAPLNAFNIPSSFPKNLGKNLAKFSKEFRQGFLCVLEIWIRFIDRLGRIASIWEGRRCAQLSTNHRICCCGFRNTRPSSCSSSSSSW